MAKKRNKRQRARQKAKARRQAKQQIKSVQPLINTIKSTPRSKRSVQQKAILKNARKGVRQSNKVIANTAPRQKAIKSTGAFTRTNNAGKTVAIAPAKAVNNAGRLRGNVTYNAGRAMNNRDTARLQIAGLNSQEVRNIQNQNATNFGRNFNAQDNRRMKAAGMSQQEIAKAVQKNPNARYSEKGQEILMQSSNAARTAMYQEQDKQDRLQRYADQRQQGMDNFNAQSQAAYERRKQQAQNNRPSGLVDVDAINDKVDGRVNSGPTTDTTLDTTLDTTPETTQVDPTIAALQEQITELQNQLNGPPVNAIEVPAPESSNLIYTTPTTQLPDLNTAVTTTTPVDTNKDEAQTFKDNKVKDQIEKETSTPTFTKTAPTEFSYDTGFTKEEATNFSDAPKLVYDTDNTGSPEVANNFVTSASPKIEPLNPFTGNSYNLNADGLPTYDTMIYGDNTVIPGQVTPKGTAPGGYQPYIPQPNVPALDLPKVDPKTGKYNFLPLGFEDNLYKKNNKRIIYSN